MEEKKTIYNYISQIFATYGIIVFMFIIFCLLIGEEARDYSSLFSLGGKGLSLGTMIQLFLIAIIISFAQILFLTDRWIKNMPLFLRFIIFFLLVMITIIVFIITFSWFPINDIKPWIGFLVSFSVCTVVGIIISRLEEQAENKKMMQALEKYQNETSESNRLYSYHN